MTAKSKQGFTGYRRTKTTRFSVRSADLVARKLISVGGVGTIVTVCTVCVFLVYVALPLFESPDVNAGPQVSTPAGQRAQAVLSDEYRTTGLSVLPDGKLDVFRLDTGEVLSRRDLAQGKDLTGWSVSVDQDKLILGYADGAVSLGRIEFTADLMPDADVPSGARGISRREIAAGPGGGLITASPSGHRIHRLKVELDKPVVVSSQSAIVKVDRTVRSNDVIFAAMDKTGRVFVKSARKFENLMTGEVTIELSGGEFTVKSPDGLGRPDHLMLSGGGDCVYIVWNNGRVVRYDTRDLDNPREAETLDLLPEPDRSITSLKWLLGCSTLLVGDSAGEVGCWFRIRDSQSEGNSDQWRLVRAHRLAGRGSAVTSIASSLRTRLALIGYADGDLRLFHVTSGRKLADVSAGANHRIAAAAIAPKEDAIYALSGGKLRTWEIDVKHPEAGVAALFAPVWYEGAAEAAHVWQSSGGDDAFEPKLGLVPLIFGTLKATLYSLMFGLPIAMLAAIYSSEFLDPKIHARVKPTIELMASLPSVVLGFLAALVIAPMVEDAIPSVLTAIFCIPFALLLGARFWQLLPARTAILLSRWRLPCVGASIVLGAWLAMRLGPTAESFLFAGDIKMWLDGQIGSGSGGWLLFTLPLTAISVGAANALWISPVVRGRLGHLGRTGTALVDLLRFLLSTLAAISLAGAVSWALNTYAWDPRGGASFLGTYVQRNALIVGFIMGFAIIPIIYTIAEDALSTVPEHLRAGSLGAGATPWQTAIRIIVPTAMSGLFSAVMIGLGRAVGETMIVLMAGGNTAVMEWNIFNGIRTLAANIAVELPEAPKDGTHYRTLFLAALVLFAMTFVINTIAEIVRLRFRKRAYQL